MAVVDEHTKDSDDEEGERTTYLVLTRSMKKIMQGSTEITLHAYQPIYVEPEFYHNIIQMLIAPEGATITSHEATWEVYGTLVWSNAESESTADLMVQYLIMDIIIENLKFFRSARITEISMGILVNLASHSSLLDKVASKEGLTWQVLLTLCLDDVKSLEQAFRLCTSCLLSSKWVLWATEIVAEPVLKKIFCIAHAANKTLHAELLEKFADLILVMCQTDAKTLLPPDVMIDLIPILVEVLRSWLSKLKQEEVYADHIIRACERILQILRVLSLLDEYSIENIYSRDLFQLLTDLIKLRYRGQVHECCLTAAGIIADMMKDSPILVSKILETEVFFENLLDTLSFSYNTKHNADRISLWTVVEIVIIKNINSMDTFGMIRVLARKLEHIEWELDISLIAGTDEEKYQVYKALIAIMHLMRVMVFGLDQLKAERCIDRFAEIGIDKFREHLLRSIIEARDGKLDESSTVTVPATSAVLARVEKHGEFYAERCDIYYGYVSSVIPPGSEDLRGHEAEDIIKYKMALFIDDHDAASRHLDIGRRIFRRRLDTGDHDGDLEPCREFQKLIYVSSLVFGEQSSSLLPWKCVSNVTDAQIKFAVRDNAQRLYASSLSSVGRGISVRKLISLAEKQKLYQLSDELAEILFRDHTRKLVEENISAALSTLKSTTRAVQTRQTIKELKEILDFNLLLITHKKHPNASSFARGLGTVSLLDGEYDDRRMDDLKLLYRTFVKYSLSVCRMEEDKLAALNQLRNIFGLDQREAESIRLDITSKVYRRLAKQG